MSALPLAMVWRDICTAHWRVAPSSLQSRLPAGLTLDTFDGDAWLSVVPFRMTRVRLRFAPVLPGFASVPEINLRTYVRAGELSGIYFFSLDANSALMVASARFMTGLPYRLARIRTSLLDARMHFTSERLGRLSGSGTFDARYEPYGAARAAQRGTLEAFLHERYRFFVVRAGGLQSGQIRHSAWSLQRARMDVTANTLGELAGQTLAGNPDHCYFSRRLEIVAGGVEPLRIAARRSHPRDASEGRSIFSRCSE